MRPTTRLLVSARSGWKGPYFVAFPSLEAAIERNIPIKTQARNCTVLPNFVGAIFHIHNGKDYTAVKITNEMIGHKLGEFSHTKQKFRWGSSGKKR